MAIIIKEGVKEKYVGAGRRRAAYLFPIVLAALVVGYELYTYELVLRRWYQVFTIRTFMKPPTTALVQREATMNLPANSPSKITPTLVLPIWKQPSLLNLLNFTWIMNNVSICKSNNANESRIMPILVHTAREHIRGRIVLRETIGLLPPYKNWIIRLVFLLGKAGHATQIDKDKWEVQLDYEHKKYGDVVIGSFTDSYHNNSYKHLMGYKWILNFCQEATFVLKMDDDIFVDIVRWLDWRTEDIERNEGGLIPDLYCHTVSGRRPPREKGNKWYVTQLEWPNDFYPDFCSAGAYGITVELLQKLYSATSEIKFLRSDDVFATGALLEAAKRKFDFKPKIKHIWGNVTFNLMEYKPFCEKGSMDAKREFRAMAELPRDKYFERNMVCMWNKMLYDRNLTIRAGKH